MVETGGGLSEVAGGFVVRKEGRRGVLLVVVVIEVAEGVTWVGHVVLAVNTTLEF